MADGDTIFALSTENAAADVNVIGTATAEVIAEAVARAVKAAKTAAGVPGFLDEQYHSGIQYTIADWARMP